MKRLVQAFVLATLVSAAQASPFPGNGDPVGVSPQWTHADRYASAGDVSGSSIPGNGDPVALPARSTYSDVHAGESNMQVGSAFPGNGDPVSLPSHSTYADRFVTDPERHAQSAID